jgi:hypothetical protein
MSVFYLTADHPERGLLWASIDPGTTCCEPALGDRRFVAFLKPFKCEEEARRALTDAGGVIRAGIIRGTKR